MTREEAIKRLTVEIGLRSSGYYDYLAHGGKQDKAEEEFLDSMGMAIAALREQPQWISVADRFPEHGTVALVWDGKFRRVGRFSRKYGWHEEYEPHDENGGVFLRNITHWMPLPRAPKEEV